MAEVTRQSTSAPRPLYAPYDFRSGLKLQWAVERWDSQNRPTSYRAEGTPVRVVIHNGKWALSNERGRILCTEKRFIPRRWKHLLDALLKAETVLHQRGQIVSGVWR